MVHFAFPAARAAGFRLSLLCSEDAMKAMLEMNLL
jgi:hypothetical protein